MGALQSGGGDVGGRAAQWEQWGKHPQEFLARLPATPRDSLTPKMKGNLASVEARILKGVWSGNIQGVKFHHMTKPLAPGSEMVGGEVEFGQLRVEQKKMKGVALEREVEEVRLRGEIRPPNIDPDDFLVFPLDRSGTKSFPCTIFSNVSPTLTCSSRYLWILRAGDRES